MKLKTRIIITEAELDAQAEEKLCEAEALYDTGHYGAATYVAGYSVECLLKLAICRRIGQDLTALFRTHDLDGLLFYSGLHDDAKGDAPMKLDFDQIAGLWNDADGNVPLRYPSSGLTSQSDADRFLKSVGGNNRWLRART